MAFTAKILSWRFRHLNIVGCLLKRRPTKGGARAPQDPPPPSYAPDERVGNSDILVCKKAQKDHSLLKGLTYAFSWSLQVDVSYFCVLHFSYGCEKARENTFWFDVYSYIKRAFTAVKRDAEF